MVTTRSFAAASLALLLGLSIVVPSGSHGDQARISDDEYRTYLNVSPEYANAERRLATAYSATRAFADAAFVAQVQREQQEWLRVRDSMALAAGPKGSGVYVQALVAATNERATALENLVTQRLRHAPAPQTRTEDPLPDATNVVPEARNPRATVAGIPERAESAKVDLAPAEVRGTSGASTPQLASPVRSEMPTTKASVEGSNTSVTGQMFLFGWLALTALGTILGVSEKITVFRNYSDLGLAFGSGLGLIVGLLFASAGAVGLLILVLGLTTFGWLAVRTFMDNRNPVSFVLALVTKVTLSALFLLTLLDFMSPSGKSREKRRQVRRNAAMWLFVLTPLVHSLVRDKATAEPPKQFMPSNRFKFK